MAGTQLLRSARWLLGYQGIRLLVGFLLGTWVARALGPSQFGLLATASAVGAIAYCGVELGMRQLFLREAAKRKHSGPIIAGTLFKLWLMTGFTVVCLTALWNAFTGTLPWQLFFPAMLPLLLTGLSVHNNWEEASHRSFVAARNNMAGYLGASGMRFMALLWLPTLPVIAWTIAAESLIAGLLGMWIGQRRGRGAWIKGWNTRVAKALFSRGMILVMGQAGVMLLLRMDTLMVEHMQGHHEAGIYGAAVRLSELVYALSPMVVTLFLPQLAALKRQNEQRFRQMASLGASLVTLLGMASAAGLWLIGPLLIHFLFGQEYEASTPVLLIHCLAAVPYFLAEWRYAILVALDRTRITAGLSWFAVAINFGLNLWWIPHYGALGAAWATLVSYGVSGLVSTWLIPELRWLARSQALALLEPLRWIIQPRERWAAFRDVFGNSSTVGSQAAVIH